MNQPEQKFNAGGVTATVWKNTGEKDGASKEYHYITVEKRYKDKNGAWKGSNSFRVDELPKLQIVAGQAFEYCSMKKEKPVV